MKPNAILKLVPFVLILLVAGCSAKEISIQPSPSADMMSPEDALGIAQATKECTDVGRVTSSVSLNEQTRTYWVDILQQQKPMCAPACVVNMDTGLAEVNWRCTGLIPKTP